MKTIESTHPLCGACGRPIALLILGDQLIALEGSAVIQGPTIVVQRHNCRVETQRPPTPSKGQGDMSSGRRGPHPTTIVDAMACARNYIGPAEKGQQDTVNHMMALGFKESTSRRALRLLGVVKSESQGFLTVRLPAAQTDPR